MTKEPFAVRFTLHSVECLIRQAAAITLTLSIVAMTGLPFGLMLKPLAATAAVAHVAPGQMGVAHAGLLASAMDA
jgi:hypothetical protein